MRFERNDWIAAGVTVAVVLGLLMLATVALLLVVATVLDAHSDPGVGVVLGLAVVQGALVVGAPLLLAIVVSALLAARTAQRAEIQALAREREALVQAALARERTAMAS